MSGINTHPQFSGTAGVPSSYSKTLADNAQSTAVTVGPGGALVTLGRDQLASAPPGGITDPGQGPNTRTTNSPGLNIPDWSMLTPTGVQLATVLLTFIIESSPQTQDTSTPLSDAESELAFIREAAQELEGEEEDFGAEETSEPEGEGVSTEEPAEPERGGVSIQKTAEPKEGGGGVGIQETTEPKGGGGGVSIQEPAEPKGGGGGVGMQEPAKPKEGGGGIEETAEPKGAPTPQGSITPKGDLGTQKGAIVGKGVPQETGEKPVSPPESRPLSDVEVFTAWINTLTEIVSTPLPTVSPQTVTLFENIRSTDPSVVESTLLTLADLESMNLTPEQKTLVESKLKELAQNIAGSVGGGGFGSFSLQLGIPELTTLLFATSIGLPTDMSLTQGQRDLVGQVLVQVSNNLATVSFASLTQPEEPSPKYVSLTSGNPQEVEKTVRSILSNVSIPPEEMTTEEFNSCVSALSTEFPSEDKMPPELLSANKEVVLTRLTEMLQKMVGEGKITNNQVTIILEKVAPTLAEGIVAINQEKYTQDLYSNDTNKIEKALVQLTGLTEEDLGTKTTGGLKEPAPEYVQITSGDKIAVKQVLTKILSSVPIPPEEMTASELESFVAALANEFPSKDKMPQGLLSANKEVISEQLMEMLQKMKSDGTITEQQLKVVLERVAPSLATSISSINRAQYIQDLYSGDHEKIEEAVRQLSGTSGEDIGVKGAEGEPFTPKQIVMQNYLAMVVAALAFLSQIRALISNLEGTLSKEIAAAKMQNLADQVQLSLQRYSKEIAKVHANSVKTMHQIHKAHLMKILMPIFTILVTIVMTIITVIAAIFAPPAAPAIFTGMSAMIFNMVVLCTTVGIAVAMCVITVADSITQMACGKGIFDKMLEDVKSPALKALINMIVQIVVAIIVTVITLGAGVGAAVGQIVSGSQQTTAIALTEALQALSASIIKQIVKAISKQIAVLLVLQIVVVPLMSSGIIFQAIIFLAKAANQNEKDSAIIAMITSLIIMLVIMTTVIAAGKAGSGGTKDLEASTKGVGQQATEVGQKSIALSIGQATKEFVVDTVIKGFFDTAKTSLEGLEKIIKTVKNAIQELATDILNPFTKAATEGVALGAQEAATTTSKVLEALQKILDSIKKLIRPENVMVLIQLLTEAMTIAQSAILVKSSFDQASIQKHTASLTKDIAAIEKTLSYLTKTADLKDTVKDINKDAVERAEEWNGLIEMVSSFIQSARRWLSSLTGRGAY